MSIEIKPISDVAANSTRLQSQENEKANPVRSCEALPQASDASLVSNNVSSSRSLLYQKNILHIINLSAASVSTDWESIRPQWGISKIVFCPQGIQNSSLRNSRGEAKDEFGNYPHWVYVLENKINGRTIPVGPVDVERLYEGDDSSLTQVTLLRREKENQLLSYKDKLILILTLQSSLGLQLNSNTLLEFIKLTEEPEQIGDEHLKKIDEAYSDLEKLWGKTFLDIAFEKFLGIYRKLNELNKTVTSRKKHLSLISTEEKNNLDIVLSKLNSGNKTSKDELQFLMSLYEKLLRCQNYFKDIEATSWARHTPVPVDINQEAKTPAYHANLKIASLLSPVLLSGDPKIVLDVGSNLSNFYRILGQALSDKREETTRILENVIDLEKDPSISTSAINPNKITANIGEINDNHLPKVQSVSNEKTKSLITNPNNFDILVTSFVLDQLNEEELKNAILAFEELFKKPPDKIPDDLSLKQTPGLAIASPEHSPLAGSSFAKILEKCGYRLILQEQNVINSLTDVARERIKTEEGPESLDEVEALVSKPYHVYVYAKVHPMDKKAFSEIPESDFVISTGSSCKRTKPLLLSEEKPENPEEWKKLINRWLQGEPIPTMPLRMLAHIFSVLVTDIDPGYQTQ